MEKWKYPEAADLFGYVHGCIRIGRIERCVVIVRGPDANQLWDFCEDMATRSAEISQRSGSNQPYPVKFLGGSCDEGEQRAQWAHLITDWDSEVLVFTTTVPSREEYFKYADDACRENLPVVCVQFQSADQSFEMFSEKELRSTLDVMTVPQRDLEYP